MTRSDVLLSGTPKNVKQAVVNTSHRVPLHRSIAADLAAQIRSGHLSPGSLLPSEFDLSVQYGVTRMTVRQALASLAAQELVERRHGRGTIVTLGKVQRQTQRPLGLAEELEGRGLIPGSHILQQEEVRPPTIVREALWLGSRAKTVLLSRLRYADETLIGLQHTYVPSALAPGLAGVDLEGLSVSRVLRERHGLVTSYADVSVEAVEADEDVASEIDAPLGTALLKSVRVSFLEGGRPLDLTTGWFFGTKYYYQFRQGVAGEHDRPAHASPSQSSRHLL
jgi:GntR family transcriptional regulator